MNFFKKKITVFIIGHLLLFSGLLASDEKIILNRDIIVSLDHPMSILKGSAALGAGIDGVNQEVSERQLSPAYVAKMSTAGLKPLAYRLRTELGIEAWHWNPEGSWSDPLHQQGYWTSATKASSPILRSYGYRLPRRGNTFDEANNDSYSRLDDGDLSTFWKSNPYLSSHYTGEPDSKHPQWVILDFGKLVPMNAVRLYWSEPYARKFRIQWAQGGAVYFGNNQPWHDFPRGNIESEVGGVRFFLLTSSIKKTEKVRFLRLWMTESSGTASPGANDPRDHMGYALREMEAGAINNKGIFHDEVIHRPDHKQTLVYTSSTDPWHGAIDCDLKTVQPGLDAVIHSGIGKKDNVLWSLPVFYDTPENSAAAAFFLRQRHYLASSAISTKPLSGLELGEEPDGQRIDPNDFGALYAQVARAIRCNNKDVLLGGPSFVTIDCEKNDTTYRSDHRPWLKRFFAQLRKQHQQKNFQFLSFEWYPFDDLLLPEESLLIKEPYMLKRALRLIRQGGVPSTFPLVITEYGYSVFAGRPEVELSAALLNADIVAQFLLLGGNTAYLYGYEPGQLSCDFGNSWGGLMMFLENPKGEIVEPLPTYFGARLLTQCWMTSVAGTCQIYPVKTSSRDSLVTAYALHRPDHRWSLLLINKSRQSSCAANLLFVRRGRKITAPWKGPWQIYSYSPAQYQWSRAGAAGAPKKNIIPKETKIDSLEDLKAAYLLPPWSITVITGCDGLN